MLQQSVTDTFGSQMETLRNWSANQLAQNVQSNYVSVGSNTALATNLRIGTTRGAYMQADSAYGTSILQGKLDNISVTFPDHHMHKKLMQAGKHLLRRYPELIDAIYVHNVSLYLLINSFTALTALDIGIEFFKHLENPRIRVSWISHSRAVLPHIIETEGLSSRMYYEERIENANIFSSDSLFKESHTIPYERLPKYIRLGETYPEEKFAKIKEDILALSEASTWINPAISGGNGTIMPMVQPPYGISQPFIYGTTNNTTQFTTASETI